MYEEIEPIEVISCDGQFQFKLVSMELEDPARYASNKTWGVKKTIREAVYLTEEEYTARSDPSQQVFDVQTPDQRIACVRLR